jgi:hypothetical protein
MVVAVERLGSRTHYAVEFGQHVAVECLGHPAQLTF